MSLNSFASFFAEMEQKFPNGPSPPKVYTVLQPDPHATKSTCDDAANELFPLLDDIIDSDEDDVEFNIFKLVKWKENEIGKDVNALVEHILNEAQDFSTKPDKNIVRNETLTIQKNGNVRVCQR